MGHRLSKIYTKTGDAGTTGLGDGSRVAKNDIRVEAYGTVDELNSQLGVLLAHPLPDVLLHQLTDIQHDLFELGAELCVPGHHVLTEAYITKLETWLDAHNADLPYLKEFILPGGSIGAAQAHVARSVCRRAERRLISLHELSPLKAHPLAYLNRLSDFLFVVARVLARHDGGTEVMWLRKNVS